VSNVQLLRWSASSSAYHHSDRLLSVQSADVSLCVLSLTDVLTSTPHGPIVRIPPSIAHLISPVTLFLFNKFDLVSATYSVPEIAYEGSGWTVSLSTGEGTAEFMSGFAEALRERYIILGLMRTDFKLTIRVQI